MLKMARSSIVIILSSVVSLSSPTSRAEWVEWLADGGMSGKFVNNINNSIFPNQQLDDFLGRATLSAGRAYQLGGYTRAYLTAEWSGDLYQRFEDLNQHTMGGKAVLTHKFGLGRQVPVLHVELADSEIFSASQLRSGNQLNTGVHLSSWCNAFMQGFIGYRFDDRHAAPRNLELDATRAIFDIQGHTLELGSHITLSRRAQLHGGYSHRWGDIVSNNVVFSLPTRFLQKVSSIADDDAFPSWIYRAQGETDTYTIGLSYALLDGHASTALHYSYVDTKVLWEYYTSHQIQLSVQYSY